MMENFMIGRFLPLFLLRWDRNHQTVEPLEYLERTAKRVSDSPVGRRAAKRFHVGLRRLLYRILEPGPLAAKIAAPDGSLANAVIRVLVFALLSRYEEYCEQERELAGLRRSFINKAGTDLLDAIQQAWTLGNDRQLINLLVSEVQYYLGYSFDIRQIRKLVHGRLPLVKSFAAAAAKSDGIESVGPR